MVGWLSVQALLAYRLGHGSRRVLGALVSAGTPGAAAYDAIIYPIALRACGGGRRPCRNGHEGCELWRERAASRHQVRVACSGAVPFL